MDWLRDNAFLLSAGINFCMLGIWTFYAALLYRQYRQQRQSKLIIHLTDRVADGAELLLVNLGQEAVHIEGVMAVMDGPDGVLTALVSDYPPSEDTPTPLSHESVLRQGPLTAASFIPIGSLDNVLQRIKARGDPFEQIERPVLEMRVVAAGRGDRFVGARRRFVIETGEHPAIVRPETETTEQLRSPKHHRQAQKWLQEASDAAVRFSRSSKG